MTKRTLLRLAAIFLVLAVGAAAYWCPAAAEAKELDQSAIRSAIAKIAVELREAYVFPGTGEAAAIALERSLAAKLYDELTDPDQFAARLTTDLRAVTDDSHMRVISGSPFANQPPITDDAGIEVKVLREGLGYIRLARFVPPEQFKPVADDAMERVGDTRALIVDLRDNGGGHPASVAYLAGFFFNAKTPINTDSIIWRNRGTTTFRTEKFWTSPPPLSYLAKPVYVLVGPRTYSASEAFAYDLQVLKRATIVGEKTRGGAHPGGLTELGAELFVVVPTGRAENPITHANWQGVGVHPDVQVAADLAQDKAVEMALHHAAPGKQK